MFKNMDYIYEVYKCKSFSKAAENLYISQPSLSATVKKVEARIGCKIFDRSANPIRLTDCGQQYIKIIEHIFETQDEFRSYLHDWNELKTGTISLGASNLFTSYILPPIMAEFKQKYPGVGIQLTESDTMQLEKLLFDGELDLIIHNYCFSPTMYKKRIFYRESLILAVPVAFAGKPELEGCCLTSEDIQNNVHLCEETKSVSVACFKDDPFIILRANNDTRVRFEKMCQDAGIEPIIVLELDQLATAFSIAKQGMGITIISDTLAQKAGPTQEVVYCKLDSPHTERNVYFYYKHNKYVTRAMEEFLYIAIKEP